MKRILTLASLLLVAAILLCACGKEPYSELTQDMTNAPDPTIVGFWYDVVQTNTQMDDVWEYRADGTLYLHQIDKEGVIRTSIEGTYSIEDGKLIQKLPQATLTYISYEVISDSLAVKEYAKDANGKTFVKDSAFARYTNTVYKR